MSFIVYFPFGNVSGAVEGSGVQTGTELLVPVNGTAFPVTFPLAYVNSATITNLAVQGTGAYELSVQYNSVTTTGFNIIVTGGPSGVTTTVSWTSFGT